VSHRAGSRITWGTGCRRHIRVVPRDNRVSLPPVDGKPARQLAVKDTVTGAGSVVSATALCWPRRRRECHAFSCRPGSASRMAAAVGWVDVSWTSRRLAQTGPGQPESLTVRRSTTCGVQRMARYVGGRLGTTRRHRLDGCPAQLFGDVAAATAGVGGRTTLARTHRHRHTHRGYGWSRAPRPSRDYHTSAC